MKTAFLSYPFDYSYMWVLQKAKLEDMLFYFSRAKYIAQKRYDSYCSKIRLTIKLLDIVIEDDLTYDAYINKKNWERFLPEYSFEKQKLFDDKEKWRLWVDKQFDLYPGLIRNKKALKLYYRLIEQYEEEWWD